MFCMCGGYTCMPITICKVIKQISNLVFQFIICNVYYQTLSTCGFELMWDIHVMKLNKYLTWVLCLLFIKCCIVSNLCLIAEYFHLYDFNSNWSIRTFTSFKCSSKTFIKMYNVVSITIVRVSTKHGHATLKWRTYMSSVENF